MAHWFSIEVLDGCYSAAGWAEAFGDALVTEAIFDGASNWDWHRHSCGTVFEVEFADELAWARFRDLAVLTALDAVPDPVSGLIIYKGRGGSAGGREPRRIRPLSGAGAVALPLPLVSDDRWSVFPEPPRRMLGLQS